MFAEHFETCWGMFFAFYDKFILELPKERKFVFCGTLVEKHWSTAGRSNLKDRGWKVIFKILLLDKLNLLLWFSFRLKPIVLIYFPAAASKILLISNVLSLSFSLSFLHFYLLSSYSPHHVSTVFWDWCSLICLNLLWRKLVLVSKHACPDIVE